MNNRRAPLQMTAPVDSVPNIPFRTFLLRAHLLRILWGFPHIFWENSIQCDHDYRSK